MSINDCLYFLPLDPFQSLYQLDVGVLVSMLYQIRSQSERLDLLRRQNFFVRWVVAVVDASTERFCVFP